MNRRRLYSISCEEGRVEVEEAGTVGMLLVDVSLFLWVMRDGDVQ